MKRLLLMIIGIVCGICCYAQRSATINKIWMQHNVTKGGKSGMVVHADFTINGLKGEKVDCTAYFYDKYKKQPKNHIQRLSNRNRQGLRMELWKRYLR